MSRMLERVAPMAPSGGDQRLSSAAGSMVTESGSSAERAVDRDFSQGGLENGEFLIVEPLDEQFRNTAKMDRHGLGHACDAGVGQGDNHAAPVRSVVRSTHQTVINQPRDTAGQTRTRDERTGGELRHA